MEKLILKANERDLENMKLVTSGRKTKFNWERMMCGDKIEFPYTSDNQITNRKYHYLIRYSANYFAKTRRIAISVFGTPLIPAVAFAK